MKKQLKNEQQNVFIEVEYLQNIKTLYAGWIGNDLTFEQIKQGSLLILETIKEHKCELFMNDGRRVSNSWDEANEWIANEWMPQAIQAGLKRFAHILSQDLYAQLSAEFMADNAQKVESFFQLKIFDNQEDAEKWLLEE